MSRKSEQQMGRDRKEQRKNIENGKKERKNTKWHTTAGPTE